MVLLSALGSSDNINFSGDHDRERGRPGSKAASKTAGSTNHVSAHSVAAIAAKTKLENPQLAAMITNSEPVMLNLKQAGSEHSSTHDRKRNK